MKLLFVNGCISQRGEDSRTLALARAFLETWRARHPDGEIETVSPEDLLALKPFEPEMLNDRTPWRASGASMRRCSPWPASSGRRTGSSWRRPSGT